VVEVCCSLHTETSYILTPHDYLILFVYHCEVCDHIQLHTLNFKVQYIGRENDVYLTCIVAAFVSSVAVGMEWGVMN
jgi:hypothetical protein